MRVELSNTFTVSVPVDEAWATLLDLERVAPCLPGAAITDVEGADYHGGVKIKVGPITAQYRGVASIVEADESAHRAVILAKGKDVGGQGGAEAQIVATLVPSGSGTQVRVDTDLALSGRVAQFGRGVISDVTGRLLNQFSSNLEAEFNKASGGRGEAHVGDRSRNAKPPGGGAWASQRPSLDDVEPLDVMGSMSGPVIRYALPGLGALALLLVGAYLLGRRNGGRLGASTPFGPVHLHLNVRDELRDRGGR